LLASYTGNRGGNVQNVNLVTGKVIDDFDDETEIKSAGDVFLVALVPPECGLRLESKFVIIQDDEYGIVVPTPESGSSSEAGAGRDAGAGWDAGAGSDAGAAATPPAASSATPRPPENCPQVRTVLMVKELYSFLHKLRDLSAETHVLRVTERSISAHSHLTNGVGSVSTNILARNLVNEL